MRGKGSATRRQLRHLCRKLEKEKPPSTYFLGTHLAHSPRNLRQNGTGSSNTNPQRYCFLLFALALTCASAGLKIRFLNGSAGSIPAPGTTITNGSGRFCISRGLEKLRDRLPGSFRAAVVKASSRYWAQSSRSTRIFGNRNLNVCFSRKRTFRNSEN